MSEGRDELRAWIAGEAAGVLPPDGAEERGWERLNAALTAGATPRADVLVGTGGGWAPWAALGVVLLGAALVAWLAWPRLDGGAEGAGRDAADGATAGVSAAAGADGLAAPGVEAAAGADERGGPEAVRSAAGEDARGAPEVAVESTREADERGLSGAVEATTGEARGAPSAGKEARQAAPRRRPPPVPGDSFAAELRIIAAAQAALRAGNPRLALRELASHAREFPRGHFAQDREALRAVGVCAAGQRRAGERLAREFLAAHPDSIHADRVREACGS